VETLSQLRKKKGWLWWHTPVVPATWEELIREWSRSAPGKNAISYPKK
jgi:hypothetical protein